MLTMRVPRIEDESSACAWDRSSFLDRYFSRKYLVEGDGGRYCVLVHSNRMVLLTLAPSHPILSQNIKISSVNFQVSSKLNRLDNKVSGKRKRGGQSLSETSVICEIDCENSVKFKVKAGIVGKLLEVNEELSQRPEMLKDPSLGYIAIIGPRIHDMEAKLAKLLAEDPPPQKCQTENTST